MRRRASRRSVSSCDSPGPRVPTPAAEALEVLPHARACAAGCTRAARARPGACPRRVTACWAKMSRISCVRSMTRASSASSRYRCCAGSSSSSTSRLSASAAAKRSFSSSSLPLPTYVRGPGRGAVLDERPTGSTPAVRASSSISASSSSAIRALGQHREDEARAPARAERAPVNVESSACHYARCRPDPRRLAARTLELVDIPSPSREEAAAVPLRHGARAARPARLRRRRVAPVRRSARGKPLVLLAGHTDTVPAQGNIPGPDRGRRGARPRRDAT